MATPPENVETAPIAADEGRRFDPRVLGLVGAIAVIALAAIYFFFLAGGEEEIPVETAPPVAVSPSPTVPEDTKKKDRPVETFDVFAARDPFESQVSLGGAPAGGTATGTDTGEGADGDDGQVLIDERDNQGGGESIGGHRVRLVDVYPSGDRAQVQVDGTVYTVDEGEQFADNFELVGTSGQCATMLYGDDEFTLCEGEEVLK